METLIRDVRFGLRSLAGIALLFDWRGAVGVLHPRSSSNESGSVGSVAIRVMALPMAGGVNQ